MKKDEIRKAYRKLALENHPDRNPDKTGAEAKIKEINAAYECLSDEKKKQEYDLNGKLPNFGSGSSNFNFRNFGKTYSIHYQYYRTFI